MFSKLLRTDDHHDHPLLGIACMGIAMFLIGIMGMFAKILSADMSPVAIAFYRNTIGVMMIGGFFVARGQLSYLKTDRPYAHIMRAAIGTTGLVLTYYTLSILSMSQATVLFFASSLIMPLLGVFLLKEYVGLPRWLAILIGFGGVVIAAQPFGVVSALGVILALVTALFHAIVGICLRWLGRTEGAMTTTFYFVFIGALCLVPFMFFVDITVPSDKVWMVVCVGLSGSFAQVFLTGAFKFADSAAVSAVAYTNLVWAVLFDLVIWGTIPTLYVLSGGAVIILCNMFIIYREKTVKDRAAKKAVNAMQPETL